MNEGFNQPQNPANRRPRRRKRNFGSNQSQGGQQGQEHGHGRSGGGQNRNNRNRNNRNNRGQRRSSVFVGPMDHSYRIQNVAGSGGGRFRNGYGSDQGSELDPFPAREDVATKRYAFVDDLFFYSKI